MSSNRVPVLGSFDADGTFARLIGLTGDLLCVLDSEGVVRAATGARGIFGDPAAELLGVNLIERIHPDDVVATRGCLRELTQSAAPLRFVRRCRCDDGTYRWIAWCVARDEGQSFAVVLHDATEQKWVEHEVQASLSLVEATLESTADGLLVADNSGQIVTFNRKFLELWGIADSVVFSGSDEIDRFCEPLLSPDADHLAMARELEEAEDVERYEVLTLQDGRVFERYSRPRRTGDVIEGRVWSFRDVTERVHAEQDLHDHLNMGIEHAVEGIARLDARGRYTSVNAAFVRMLGYELPDLLGKEAGMLCHPEDRARLLAARDKMGLEGKEELELRAVRKDGSVILLRALLVRAAPKDAGFYGFLHDITEQKAMERRLLTTDRMMSMGTLAAGVAHEINNPLSFVIMNTSVLEQSLPTSPFP